MDTLNTVPRKIDNKDKILLRIKRKFLSHPLLIRKFLVGILTIFVIILFGIFAKNLINTKTPDFLNFVKGFVFTKSSKVNIYKGRLNVLLMGKSGMGNDSPNLTDSMILFSVGMEKPSIFLISVPRDIWIPSIRAKINSAYYWGNEKEKGGGLLLSKNLVEEIVGVPVEYAVVVDYSVFKEVIDTIGGIEIYVDRSFMDEKYPIKGRENLECPEDEGKTEAKKEYKCRYETIVFQQGLTKMDGETALKYARSRNAEGEEGTDLARDKRQQKVISAIKDKILSPKVLLNPNKLITLKKIAETSIETDIDSLTFGILGGRVLVGRKDIKSYVLDEKYLEHPLISQKYDYQYVFISRTGSWDDVKKWVETLY